MNEILVKCQYLCTYIRVAGPRSLIAPVEGRMDGMEGRQAGRQEEQLSFRTGNYTNGIQAQSRKHVCGRATCPDDRFQTLTGRGRHSAASWLPGHSYSYWEGHLSEDELGSGCLAPTHPVLPHPPNQEVC